jgi:hypothetical protein
MVSDQVHLVSRFAKFILARPVMPGLVPGIHVLDRTAARKTWVAGTSPAMTKEAFVIARSEATKQSMMSHPGYELLRGTCHRARIRATRWLAMTASIGISINPASHNPWR